MLKVGWIRRVQYPSLKIQKVTLLLLCFCAVVANHLWAQDLLSGKAFVDALRQGGYNIYFRHAATDWSKNDHVDVKGDWTSCDPDKMRQLSAGGRAVAQRIGEAIRRLGIPIGRVLSSEYCRTRETAQNLDLGPVTPTLAVMNMRAADFVGGRDAVIDRARRALATPPQEGTNAIFVAHGNLMRAVSGAYAGEAGAVIFLPQGNGEFQLVAQLDPEDWELLVRQFASAE
jgi:broad specificity phosphatase PhoE